MHTEKVTCRVNRTYDGLLHLHQHELKPAVPPDPLDDPDDDGTPGAIVWFGSIDLAADALALLTLWGQDVLIELEDGRIGHARCLSGESRETYTADDGEGPGRLTLLYVVGLTSLD